MRPQTQQHDLFEPLLERSPAADVVTLPSPAAAPIAIPCGFTNAANHPCRRLAHRPVMVEGEQLACRGRPMLFCDPDCYAALPVASPPSSDDTVVGGS